MWGSVLLGREADEDACFLLNTRVQTDRGCLHSIKDYTAVVPIVDGAPSALLAFFGVRNGVLSKMAVPRRRLGKGRLRSRPLS
jgi:hypothetical protein